MKTVTKDGLVFCHYCQISIMPAQWDRHIESKRHKEEMNKVMRL